MDVINHETKLIMSSSEELIQPLKNIFMNDAFIVDPVNNSVYLPLH
jgi:hypothetical protein